jgi:WD40 repeat protein
VWDEQGNVVMDLPGHKLGVYAVAFVESGEVDHPTSPCGTELATVSGDGTTRVWNIAATTEFKTLRLHTASIESIDFSPDPDGRYIATASVDGTAHIWRSDTFSLVKTLKHQARINRVVFDQTGRTIATAGFDGKAAIWGIDDEAEPVMLRPEDERVHSIAFRPGEDLHVATGDGSGNVDLWDSRTGERIATLLQIPYPVRVVNFDSTGDLLIAGSENGLAHIIEIDSGHPITTLSHGSGVVVYDAAFSPDNESVYTLSGDGYVRQWRLKEGQRNLDYELDAQPMEVHPGGALTIAFSSASDLFATGGRDREIQLHKAVSHKQLPTLASDRDIINDIAFQPDGKILAAATDDGLVRLYLVHTEDLQQFAIEMRVTRGLTEEECIVFEIKQHCRKTP